MKEKFKALKDILWAEEGTVGTLNERYLEDFCTYWFELGGNESEPSEQIPLYVVLPNYNKVLCCAMMIMAAYWTTMGIVSLVHGKTIGLLWLAISCAVCVIGIIACFPPNYRYYLRKYRKVRVIGLFTKKELNEYERAHETLRIMVKPYLAKKAEEEAAKKSAEDAAEKAVNAMDEARKRAEAAEEEKARQEARVKFYPQFLVLLSYVETNFKVSTPDPNCVEGKFTIALPIVGGIGKEEWSFDFGGEEVDRLIAMIADMDIVMRRRVELHEMVAENAGMFAGLANSSPSDEIYEQTEG